MVSLLSTCEQQITELSHQIYSKLQEYVDLRTSIDRSCHSWSTAEGSEVVGETNPKPPPISRCPDVILNSIFEIVAEEGSHKIPPLLTVSKRFHRLAMSNPLLWTKIFIVLHEDLAGINSLSTLYVNACLERSGDALLDVVLDCRSLPQRRAYMQAYICDLIRRSVEDKQDKIDILDYLSCEFRGEVGYGCQYPLYERKLELLLGIIRTLTGPENVHVRRWRSTIISSPYFDDLDSVGGVDEAMRSLLGVEMPNLQSLLIDRFDESKSDGPSLWPALRELTTSAMMPIGRVPIDFTSLTSLNFHHYNYGGYISNFSTLSQCVALQELTINCFGGAIINGPPIEVGLPMLTLLVLEGHVGLLDYVRFISPNLEDWSLHCEPCNKFPDVDAVYVQWDCRKAWNGNSLDAERSCLLQLLSSFKRTRIFKLLGLDHAKPCFADVCRMGKEKRLPSCLEVIDIDGAGSLNLVEND
ncbi:hypothetical protein FRC20_001748 [Serendipita sp. 405]|nr:hypothetical protein FRC20_001748 [Serendipita sp. 405]